MKKYLIVFCIIIAVVVTVTMQYNSDDVKKENTCNKISISDIKNTVDEYFGNENIDRSNFAYNYTDEENKIIVIGLIDISKEKQEEFIRNAFKDKCMSDYIKNNKVLEFRESKEVFTSRVITSNDDTILVEVLKDSKSFKKQDKVIVKIEEKLKGAFKLGDKIKITFNGSVEMSNPPKIGAFEIENI